MTTFNKRTAEKDYWSISPVAECPIVRSTMPRDQVLQIKTNLKCSKAEDEDPNDPAWQVRVILEMVRKNIKCFGFFETALSIDEMMIKFFGRLKMKQFIPNKPIKFGIKMWGLCDTDGFLFQYDIYSGNDAKNYHLLRKCALVSWVVLKMLRSSLLSNIPKKLHDYHIYFDNFFCNPDLMVHLKKIALLATGTVRQNGRKICKGHLPH